MEEDIFMKYHDGKDRCSWANPKNPIYIDYHDKEWGVPVYDDHKLFEMLNTEPFLNIYGSLQIIRSFMRREKHLQNYPTRFQRI